jgi:transcriptional regulator with XRE-family HTH domain
MFLREEISRRRTMQASELKTRRVLAGISGDILCQAASVSRSRLSVIERGYVVAKPEELERLTHALDRLVDGKARMDAVAAEVGWPTVRAAA